MAKNTLRTQDNMRGDGEKAGPASGEASAKPQPTWILLVAVVFLVIAAVLFFVSAPTGSSLGREKLIRDVIRKYQGSIQVNESTGQVSADLEDFEQVLMFALIYSRCLTKSSAVFNIGAGFGSLTLRAVLFVSAFLIWRFILRKKRHRVFMLVISSLLLAWSVYSFGGHLAVATTNRELNEMLRRYPGILQSFLQDGPTSGIDNDAGTAERRLEELSSVGKTTEYLGHLLKENIAGREEVQSESFDPSEWGSTTPLVLLINRHAIQLQNDFKRMNTEIESQDISSAFEPRALGSSRRIASTRLRLREIGLILDKYETLMLRRMDEIATQVNALDIPSETKRGVMDGIQKGRAGATINTKASFDIWRELVGRLDEFLGFMLSRQGRFEFVGEQVYFESDGDADTYNRHLQLIAAAAEKESERLSRMEKEAAASGQKLLDLTR